MNNAKLHDGGKLLQLLAEGSEIAFSQVFEHYRSSVFNVALRFLKSHSLAEETVQDVFLKIWLRRAELPKVVSFEAYIRTMTRNNVFDRMKAIAKEESARGAMARHTYNPDNTDHAVIEKQYDELLNTVVNSLPPQQKHVFTLARVEGLSHEAIAEQMQISRLTVKTHMAKALQTIRQMIHHHITSFVVFLALFMH